MYHLHQYLLHGEIEHIKNKCCLAPCLTFAIAHMHRLWQMAHTHTHINNIQQSSKVQPRSCLGSRFQYLRWEPGSALKWELSLWGLAQCEMQSQHREGRCSDRREGREKGVWNNMNGSCGREKVRPLVILCKCCRLDPSDVHVTFCSTILVRAWEKLPDWSLCASLNVLYWQHCLSFLFIC